MALATTRVALVTGAARGIGRAIALRLANDGLDVVVNDRASSPELDALVQEIKSKGRRSLAVPADISLEPEVEKSIRKVVQDLGSLDVMVANAGIVCYQSFLNNVTETGSLKGDEATVESFDRMMAVNARGTMLCYKHAGKQMIAQGRGGRIIGACSLAGKQAREFGKYGITVNAYAPGIVESPMTDETRTRFGPDGLAGLVASSALKRTGNPEDIAGLVSYLASDDSSFVTGQSVSINGGLFFD
ncbi:hypothetical protein BJY52DRAFT_1220556 [Lactarius psammicola]|nr:hypothetical protein BJY52DRAFT_1220556 [Lactarius psammicola]